MLDVRYSSKFRREFKSCLRRGYDIGRLQTVIDALRIPELLPPKTKITALEEITPDTENATLSQTGCLFIDKPRTNYYSTVPVRTATCSIELQKKHSFHNVLYQKKLRKSIPKLLYSDKNSKFSTVIFTLHRRFFYFT